MINTHPTSLAPFKTEKERQVILQVSKLLWFLGQQIPHDLDADGRDVYRSACQWIGLATMSAMLSPTVASRVWPLVELLSDEEWAQQQERLKKYAHAL